MFIEPRGVELYRSSIGAKCFHLIGWKTAWIIPLLGAGSLNQLAVAINITITYHRPSVRGRTVWGDISSDKVAALIKANSIGPGAETEGTVDGAPGTGKDFPMAPNGHVWRAGANEATKLTVSDDVLINGQRLAAGAYSLHVITGKDEWTVIFNKTSLQWGIFPTNPTHVALHVMYTPT